VSVGVKLTDIQTTITREETFALSATSVLLWNQLSDSFCKLVENQFRWLLPLFKHASSTLSLLYLAIHHSFTFSFQARKLTRSTNLSRHTFLPSTGLITWTVVPASACGRWLHIASQVAIWPFFLFAYYMHSIHMWFFHPYT